MGVSCFHISRLWHDMGPAGMEAAKPVCAADGGTGLCGLADPSISSPMHSLNVSGAAAASDVDLERGGRTYDQSRPTTGCHKLLEI